MKQSFVKVTQVWPGRAAQDAFLAGPPLCYLPVIIKTRRVGEFPHPPTRAPLPPLGGPARFGDFREAGTE